MQPMTDSEIDAFLREGTRTAKLSVNLPGGRPTVVPVWFLWTEDRRMIIDTGAESAKAKALVAEPRSCLLVDLEEPPYAFVKIDATAEIRTHADELLAVATEIGGRYMGQDRAEEFGRRNGGEGQVVIEFTPTRIVALGDVAA